MKTIPHGQGAFTLRHIPIDHTGRPRIVSSATFAIDDLRYSEDSPDRAIDSGAATIGTVNTAITVAAGPLASDADLLVVTANTNIAVGRPYLIVATSGDQEMTSVRAIDTLNVYTHHDIRSDYAVGALLRSVEITATFPLAEANDDVQIEAAPHPYQVTWTYTIDSDVYVAPVLHWLARTTDAPIVSELDVLRAMPTIGARLRGRASIADAIAVATEDYRADILSSGRFPNDFRGSSIASVAIRDRALEYALRWCGPAQHDVAEADKFRAHYQYLITQLLSGVPRPGVVTVASATNVGVQDTRATHSLFRRR